MPQASFAPGAHDALLVVKTPLQMLNAIEARYSLGFDSPFLYVFTSTHNSKREILDLVDPSHWAGVHCFDFRHIWNEVGLPALDNDRWQRHERFRMLSQWLLRNRFEATFRPWHGVPTLVIGNYLQVYFQHLVAQVQPGRCIVVDDGTDTLRIAAARCRWYEQGARPKPDVAPVSPKGRLVKRHVMWQGREADALTFFSTYDVDLPPPDTLLRNTYEHLRERSRTVVTNGRCYFLGQPLIEDGYVTVETYRDLLAGVVRSFAGREVVYLPHPREQRLRLGTVLAGLNIALGAIDKPLEFHLMEATTLPAVVASFFCSALDNCRLIWDHQMRLVAFRIAPQQLRVCQDFVADIYRYFVDRTDGTIEVYDPGHAV